MAIGGSVNAIRDRVGQPQVRAWSAMQLKAEVI